MEHAHPPALFLADSPGIDFLNSVATPVDVQIDWIDDGDGLLAWLTQAQLVPAEALQAIRTQAMPGELDNIAAQARALREWFREIVQKHKGQPLQPEDLRELAPLNRLLERDERYTEVVAHNHDGAVIFELQPARRWRSPESLLLPIAEVLAKVVCDEDFTDVKACEGVNCSLMFADHTRGRMRRWCSMAICGNRAKVAAHRKRQKESAAG